MTCQTYFTVTDGAQTLAQCEQCHERQYFKTLYFAKNWANAHTYDDPHLIRNALKYAQDWKEAAYMCDYCHLDYLNGNPGRYANEDHATAHCMTVH